jgi:cation:H+ antiporter
MLMLLLWFGSVVLVVAIMQWGASRAADLLEQIRDRFALPATAGGALMGLATASPETAVNVASVGFGWPDLGLGAALGSNIPALPFAFALAYLGARSARRAGEPAAEDASTVRPQAVPVQVLPYLAIVLLLAVLTLPPRWSGLQPIDGVILFLAWVAFFGRAVMRRPWRTQSDQPPLRGIWKPVVVAFPPSRWEPSEASMQPRRSGRRSGGPTSRLAFS